MIKYILIGTLFMVGCQARYDWRFPKPMDSIAPVVDVDRDTGDIIRVIPDYRDEDDEITDTEVDYIITCEDMEIFEEIYSFGEGCYGT